MEGLRCLNLLRDAAISASRRMAGTRVTRYAPRPWTRRPRRVHEAWVKTGVSASLPLREHASQFSRRSGPRVSLRVADCKEGAMVGHAYAEESNAAPSSSKPHRRAHALGFSRGLHGPSTEEGPP